MDLANSKESRPIFSYETDCNGNNVTNRKVYSYAALICRKGGSDVSAVRCSGFVGKLDVLEAVKQEHPGWNVKGIYKLYEEDFQR